MLLYNSATHKKAEFTTHTPGHVEMYTCGPTVYHFAHIGNLRSYIMEDVLECTKVWRNQVQLSSQTKKSANPKKVETKTRPNIPRKARDILEAWFKDNVDSPYPKLHDKERLCIQTGLSMKKIDNWFINERSRKWHLYKRNSSLH